MPIAFLTGGTGFVGGHVTRAMTERGWTVRLLSRGQGRTTEGLLRGLSVEEVPGELSRPEGFGSAIAGVDAIVHVAGLVKARSLEDYREVNVRGTERLLRAAAKAAPDALFLLVSSQAAAGPAIGGRPVCDADPPRPVSWYGLSKREAEVAVAALWKGPWIVVRPGVVYGPGDRALLTYFRMAAAGWLPVPAGRSRFQILGVDQASLAIALAASRRDLAGRTGFLCDPEPIRIRALARLIASIAPRGVRLAPVPGPVVRLLGMGGTAVERFTGRSGPFNTDKAREILSGDWLCDAEPMRRALSLPDPVPLEQGLRATWDWYRSAGWIAGTGL